MLRYFIVTHPTSVQGTIPKKTNFKNIPIFELQRNIETMINVLRLTLDSHSKSWCQSSNIAALDTGTFRDHISLLLC